MKSTKLFLAAMLLLAIVSCKKTTSVQAVNLSNAEAANLVTGSLLFGSNGLGTTFGDALAVSQSLSLNINSTSAALVNSKIISRHYLKTSVKDVTPLTCGTTFADTVVREGAVESSDYFAYRTIYNFTLNCNGAIPNSITGTSTFTGNYTGIYALVTDAGNSNFTVSGLPPADTALVFSGSYTRSGTFTSTIDTTNHGNYNIAITISKFTVIKPTAHVSSTFFAGGSATISITGNVAKKGNFSYTGTLVVNADGNYTSTLTLAGEAYSVNLLTGLIIKKP